MPHRCAARRRLRAWRRDAEPEHGVDRRPHAAAARRAGRNSAAGNRCAPAILETVTAEAARLSNVAADQVAVVRAEPAVWSDGSLGCPQPNEMYTQALVNGYWIILQAGNVPYDFRVASDGSYRVCPHPESSDSADLARPY